MNLIYAVVHRNPYNNSSSIEVAFSKEEDAIEYLHNMYLSEDGYESYKYDIEEIELDPAE